MSPFPHLVYNKISEEKTKMTNFKKIFENLAHEKLYSISPLEKGFSNTNYFVNDRYVLRIKSKYEELLACRGCVRIHR